MWTYRNPVGTRDIVVDHDGTTTPLHQEVFDSTAGLAWGNDGDGSYNTAASILIDYRIREGATRQDALWAANVLRTGFVYDFVMKWRDGWSIDSDSIGRWIAVVDRMEEPWDTAVDADSTG